MRATRSASTAAALLADAVFALPALLHKNAFGPRRRPRAVEMIARIAAEGNVQAGLDVSGPAPALMEAFDRGVIESAASRYGILEDALALAAQVARIL